MAVNDSREVVIEATPEEILDVIADVETMPEWSSQQQRVEILEGGDDDRPRRVKMNVKSAGISDEQVVDYTWTDNDVPNQFDIGACPEMRKIFTERFASKTRDEWSEIFAGTDACVTPVLTWTEAAQNEHLKARSTVVEANGVEQAAPAPRFSRRAVGAHPRVLDQAGQEDRFRRRTRAPARTRGG